MVGTHHNCALLDNEDLKCWGYNAYGQLGTGNTTYYGRYSRTMGDDLPVVQFQ